MNRIESIGYGTVRPLNGSELGMNGSELKQLLQDGGLSQRGAARLLGVDERTVRRYVAGAAIPVTVQIAVRCLVQHRAERE